MTKGRFISATFDGQQILCAPGMPRAGPVERLAANFSVSMEALLSKRGELFSHEL